MFAPSDYLLILDTVTRGQTLSGFNADGVDFQNPCVQIHIHPAVQDAGDFRNSIQMRSVPHASDLPQIRADVLFPVALFPSDWHGDFRVQYNGQALVSEARSGCTEEQKRYLAHVLEPRLMCHYGLLQEHVAFYPSHDEIMMRLEPIIHKACEILFEDGRFIPQRGCIKVMVAEEEGHFPYRSTHGCMAIPSVVRPLMCEGEIQIGKRARAWFVGIEDGKAHLLVEAMRNASVFKAVFDQRLARELSGLIGDHERKYILSYRDLMDERASRSRRRVEDLDRANELSLLNI